MMKLTRMLNRGLNIKKINDLIHSKYLIDSFRDTVCYVSNTSLVCTNGTLTNLFSSTEQILDPYVVGNDGAIGVGWRDVYGKIYYGQFNSGEVSEFSFLDSSPLTSNNFQISLDLSLVAEILTLDAGTVIQTLTGIGTRSPVPLFGFLGYSSTDFSWGRDVLQNTWSCNQDLNSIIQCYFSDTNQNFSPLTALSFTALRSVTAMLSPPVLDKSCGLYISDGSVKFIGVPYCYDGSFSGSCSFASIPLIENIPVLESVTQVSLGEWGGCAISGGSLSCWGLYTTHFGNSTLWNTYESVTRVSIYDSGGCVQYIDEGVHLANCWGPLSLSVNQVTLSSQVVSLTEPIQLQCPTQNIGYRDLCFDCLYGEILKTTEPLFLQCVNCTSLSGGFPSARGRSDSGCVDCLLGSTTNASGSMCVSCPPNSFRTVMGGVTMTQCEECRAGSQSALDFQSCVECPDGTARSLGQTSCSVCPEGKIPSTDKSTCISCPQPQIFVGNPPVCQECPLGQNAKNGACANCQPPNYRSISMQDCTPCPEGFTPSPDFRYCVPCPPLTVRKNTSQCYLCPSGSYPSEDRTQCLSTGKQSLKFFLSLGKSASICTGILVILLSSLLLSMHKITHAQSLIGYVIGLMIVCGAFLI